MAKLSLRLSCYSHSIRRLAFFILHLLLTILLIKAMNPFRTGKLVLFQVTYDRDWHFFEIVFFVILGIFGVRYQAKIHF